MPDAPYPGALTEIRFLTTYHRDALRKPQVAADALLRAMTTAPASDRPVLVAAVAGQLVAAALGLVAVYKALDDRSQPIARRLAQFRPGLPEWEQFAQEAASMPPEVTLRSLGLDETALPHVERLRGEPDLAWVGQLIRAFHGGGMVLTTGPEAAAATAVVIRGVDDAGPIEVNLGTDESEAADLADYTAELTEIARGLLGSYLGARLGAGRVD